MVLNATFNNISAKSWRSVLLVEETGVTSKVYSILYRLYPAQSGYQMDGYDVRFALDLAYLDFCCASSLKR